MKKIFWLLLLIPLIGHAEIYKCKVKNKMVFSDKPCGENAKRYHGGSNEPLKEESLVAKDNERIPDKAEVNRLITVMKKVRDSISNHKASIGAYWALDRKPPDAVAANTIASYPGHPLIDSISITPDSGVLTINLVKALADDVGGNKMIYTPHLRHDSMTWACSSNLYIRYVPWCK